MAYYNHEKICKFAHSKDTKLADLKKYLDKIVVSAFRL